MGHNILYNRHNGEPKAVAYSHRQLVLHTMGLLAGLGPIECQTACMPAMLYADHADVSVLPGFMRRPCLASSRSMRVATPRRICCG